MRRLPALRVPPIGRQLCTFAHKSSFNPLFDAEHRHRSHSNGSHSGRRPFVVAAFTLPFFAPVAASDDEQPPELPPTFPLALEAAHQHKVGIVTPEVLAQEEEPSMLEKMVFAVRWLLRIPRLAVKWLPVLAKFLSPFHTHDDVLAAITSACQSSGPTFIKLAQWASTRPDLFSDDVCCTLAKLQSTTRPHTIDFSLLSFAHAFRGIVVELNETTAKSLQLSGYTQFPESMRHGVLLPNGSLVLVDETPIGSGSIAQVHYCMQFSASDSTKILAASEAATVVSRDAREFAPKELAMKVVRLCLFSAVSDPSLQSLFFLVADPASSCVLADPC